MNPSADEPRRLLACLSDASRFRIVGVLAEAERCVTEIAEAVGLSQSCTTRHLQALGRDGIVRRRRDGKRVLFRIDDRDPAIRDLLAWAGTSAAPAPKAPAAPRPGTRRQKSGPPEGPGGTQGNPVSASGADPEDSAQDDEEQTVRQTPTVRPGDLEDYLL